MQLRGPERAPARRCAAPLEASTCPAAAGRCCCDCCRTCTRRRGTAHGHRCTAELPSPPAPHPGPSHRSLLPASAGFLLCSVPLPTASVAPAHICTLIPFPSARVLAFVFPTPCVEILVLHVEYRYVKYSSPFPSPPIPPAAVGCVCTDCFPCPVHCSAVGQLPPPFPVSPLPPEQRFVLCVRNSC